MKSKKHILARRLAGAHSAVWVSLLSVALTLLTAGLLLLVMGKNPVTACYSFLQGCGFAPKANYGGGSGMLSDLTDFLNYLAPLLLASLSFIVGFKAGLFNIGIAGQMLLSGFLATVLFGYNRDLPPAAAKPLVIAAGILVGALCGALIGFLKYRFNIHEVVSTIMINYIISYLTGFFINNRYVDMMTRTSRTCQPGARLTWTNVPVGGVNCKLPLGIVIAVVMALAVQFLFARTTLGFELKAVGRNPRCAKYCGINVGKGVVLSMALSGMLAGLAGVTYYLGYTNTIIPKTLAGMGYDSISVALLGSASPVGAIFAAVIVSIFQQGANYMSSMVGVSKEIASLITGILLLYASCGNYMKLRAEGVLQREADREPGGDAPREKEADREPGEDALREKAADRVSGSAGDGRTEGEGGAE